jgi:hypothetical protein
MAARVRVYLGTVRTGAGTGTDIQNTVQLYRQTDSIDYNIRLCRLYNNSTNSTHSNALPDVSY